MAEATVTTVRRVYLRPGIAPKSMYHNAMAAAPRQPDAQPGDSQMIVTLTFVAGVARDVPLATYELFAGLGIATNRPAAAPIDMD